MSRYGQNPVDLLVNTAQRAFNNESGPGLVDLLISQFPLAYGDDRQSIGKLDFPFFKRAQLVALELHDRAVNSGTDTQTIMPFVDIDSIGPIADYEVPRSLRGLGIISVSDSLAHRIQNWVEIPKDSQEEIELRAASVVACVRLLLEINKLRQTSQLPLINISHLDYWLWSQVKKVAKDINPHLTKTMAY